ncbi:MAG TPA: DUF362 domain-containing protein [Candidatus Avilachnospira avicola]|nr:DUF362 domain-containing protein [Candidatus Avilachnospira avicola]
MEKNDIIIIHGTDYKDMAKKVLEAADVAGRIGDRTRSVGLKPNLVTSRAPETGATTHAELLEGAIEYLQEHGFKDICIMEGSWVGEITPNAFREAGYDRVVKKYGVPFYDLQRDSYKEYDARGMKIKVCDRAMNIGYMINMPVLKGHCQTIVTCALKNNKGTIPNSEKRRFHTLGLHKPIAHLNTVARNDFILVDNICGDLDFEEGGNPVEMDRVLGFLDPVLCDTFVSESMGYDKSDIEYIVRAEQLGVGSTDLEHANIIYLNEPVSGRSMRRKTRRVEALERYIDADDACSACYGSLIYAMDRLNDRGMLGKGTKKVCIGQGYKGKTGELGVGSCTACFKKSLKGCPPKARDMLEFLEENL